MRQDGRAARLARVDEFELQRRAERGEEQIPAAALASFGQFAVTQCRPQPPELDRVEPSAHPEQRIRRLFVGPGRRHRARRAR